MGKYQWLRMSNMQQIIFCLINMFIIIFYLQDKVLVHFKSDSYHLSSCFTNISDWREDYVLLSDYFNSSGKEEKIQS